MPFQSFHERRNMRPPRARLGRAFPGFSQDFPHVCLVLQQHFVVLGLSSLVMAGFGSVLVAAAPGRPGPGGGAVGDGGDQVCQETADLAERDRDEAAARAGPVPGWPGQQASGLGGHQEGQRDYRVSVAEAQDGSRDGLLPGKRNPGIFSHGG